jgi:hypothetical protein
MGQAMRSCYEEAICAVNNPVDDFVEMGFCKPYPPHTILHEWEVSPEQWRKATEPLKQIYIKDFLSYFLFFIFCYLGLPTLIITIYWKRYPSEYGYIYSILSFIFVPILLLIVLGTLIAFRRVRKPNKHVFFMTNRGIFNGRIYTIMLQEYQLDEKNCKFSLLLKQCNMFNLAGSGGSMDITAGTGGRTHTFWNDFFYNEADKIKIYTIIDLWEQYNIIKPKNAFQHMLLHDYLKSQPADMVEQIKESYQKPIYVRNS